MSVDSAACTETVAEELVESTSGGKTYLVPKTLAEEVLRRRSTRAARPVGPAMAAPKRRSKRNRRRRRGISAQMVHVRPGRGRVRLLG